jgi:potassium-dependent mechanosensitive channel
MRAIEAQRHVDAEFEAAYTRVEEEARQEADRLQLDEATLDSAKTTVADLRQLRSEIDGRKIRLEAVDARIGYANAQMLRVESSINALSQTTPAEPRTIEEQVQIVKLRRLRDLRKLLANSIEQLSRGRTAVLRRLALLEERAALAQAHSQITLFDEAKELAGDPRADALREIVARLVEDSVRLGNQAASLISSELGVRRNLLEMQADRTFLRSNLRAGDIELMGIRAHLEFLRTILAEPSVPVRLLEEATAALDGLSRRAEHRRSAIAEARRQLADQDALLPASSTDIAAQLTNLSAIGEQMRTLAGDQEAEIGRLEAMIVGLRKDFADRVRAVEARTLFLRHSLPASAEAWERTRGGLARLPARIGEGFTRAVEQLVEAVRYSTPLRLAAAGLVIAGLGLAAVWGRWALRHSLVEPGRADALVLPAAALRGSLLILFPAAAWFAVAKIMRVPDASVRLVLGVLAVWPVVAFVLDMALRLLLPDAASAQSAVRRHFYGQLRWTMILGGVVVGLATITHTLVLSPTLADLVGRTTMLCLLLMAVPGLLLPKLILTVWNESRGEPPLRIRIMAGLSVIVPVALTSAALLGFAGYLDLAWGMTGLLVWILVIGSAWVLMLRLIRDGAARLREHIAEKQGDWGEVWIVDFFDPADRLVRLGLTFIAGWALVSIYGWTADTPGLRQILAFCRTPVVSLGQSTLTIQDIAIAVLMVVIAFWVGGWSRHVSYNLALVRIHDLGIRHSLSIFVQYVVTVLGLLLALKLIGFDLTALTFFAASLGIGIGFGLQNVVNNFISGILLLAERPLRVDDKVTIGSATGDVTHIGIRSLTVLTAEKKEVIIPNAAVISESFTNWTKTDDTLREVVMFRVSIFDNAERAAELIAEVANSTDGVLPSPPPKATLWEITDIGISIRLQYFIHAKGPDFDIRDSVLHDALEALATEGFTVPTFTTNERPLLPLHGREPPVPLTGQDQEHALPLRSTS